MAFSFRLASVLEYRKRKTEQLEVELSELTKKASETAARIAALEDELDSQRAMVGASSRGVRLDLETIRHAIIYGDWLEKQIAVVQAELAEQETLVEAKRQQLVAAHQDQKAIERLRERELLRARQVERWTEERNAEELGTIGFNTRQQAKNR